MDTITKIKAEIISHGFVADRVYAASDLTQQTLRAAESMKLFDRDGMIHYGKWLEWRRAGPEESKRLLEEFRSAR